MVHCAISLLVRVTTCDEAAGSQQMSDLQFAMACMLIPLTVFASLGFEAAYNCIIPLSQYSLCLFL